MLKEVCNEHSNVMKISQEDFLTKRELQKLNIPKHEKGHIDYWFRCYGDYYYLKYVDGLNEFIGQNLADVLELPSARYRLVKYKGNIQVASRYFKTSNYNYFNAFELSEKMDLRELLTNKYPMIRELLLRLFALDIFTRQGDRVDQNLIFKTERDGSLYLGEIFDYTNSFCYSRYLVYENPIMNLKLINKDFINSLPLNIKNKEYFEMLKKGNVADPMFVQFIHENPELVEHLNTLLNLDSEEFLSQLERQLEINLLQEYKEYYLNEFETSKILVRSII